MPVIVRGLAGGIKEVDINPILFNGVFTTFKMYVTCICVKWTSLVAQRLKHLPAMW